MAISCRDRLAVWPSIWGAETKKAIENFQISGEPIPRHVARWLGRIKAAAARVNAELGLLDADKAERIAAAADRVAAGELDEQFPIDVFQTGSGTSSNMNANEVIASLAGEDVHANDDVNMGQSSNDVFPSAVHLAALEQLTNDLIPALDRLAAGTRGEGGRVRRRRQVGSHAPDGCGARHAWAGVRRLRGAGSPGNRADRGDARRVWARSRWAAPQSVPASTRTRSLPSGFVPLLTEETGLAILPPADPFEAQAARDGLVEASGRA